MHMCNYHYVIVAAVVPPQNYTVARQKSLSYSIFLTPALPATPSTFPPAETKFQPLAHISLAPSASWLSLVLPCVAPCMEWHIFFLELWEINCLLSENHLLLCWPHYTWKIIKLTFKIIQYPETRGARWHMCSPACCRLSSSRYIILFPHPEMSGKDEGQRRLLERREIILFLNRHNIYLK